MRMTNMTFQFVHLFRQLSDMPDMWIYLMLFTERTQNVVHLKLSSRSYQYSCVYTLVYRKETGPFSIDSMFICGASSI